MLPARSPAHHRPACLPANTELNRRHRLMSISIQYPEILRAPAAAPKSSSLKFQAARQRLRVQVKLLHPFHSAGAETKKKWKKKSKALSRKPAIDFMIRLIRSRVKEREERERLECGMAAAPDEIRRRSTWKDVFTISFKKLSSSQTLSVINPLLLEMRLCFFSTLIPAVCLQ